MDQFSPHALARSALSRSSTNTLLLAAPLQEVNRLVPGDVGYLSLLAKQWSDLTFYYDVTTDSERQLVNLKALEYADKVRHASRW